MDCLTAWVVFGARISKMHEIGLLSTDLHKDNIIYTKEDSLVCIDCGGTIIIDYPSYWEKIPKGLMSLFRWLDIDEIAAFRFGYIQHGGYIAELVFKRFRDKLGFHSFRDLKGVVYNPLNLDFGASDVVDNYLSWKELRSRLPNGLLTTDSIDISKLNKWRSERKKVLGPLFNNPKKVRKIFSSKCYYDKEDVTVLADEYHYNKHLVAALRSSDLYSVLESLLNLHRICIWRMRYTTAFGLLYFYERLQDYYSDNIWVEGMKYFENVKRQMFEYISERDKKDFSCLEDIWNVFHYMWCLDDLEHGTLLKELPVKQLDV